MYEALMEIMEPKIKQREDTIWKKGIPWQTLVTVSIYCDKAAGWR